MLQKDKSADVRRAAADTLGKIGADATDVVSALLEALEDEASGVRYAGACALGNMGRDAKSAVPALIEALKDEDSHVRRAAARALGKMGPAAKSAVPALTKALKASEVCKYPGGKYDVYSDLRRAAACALGNIGPDAKSAVAVLTKALEDEYAGVRSNVVSALKQLGAFTPELEVATTEFEIKISILDMRHFGVELGRFGRIIPPIERLIKVGKPAVPVLIELVKDEDEDKDMRQGAARVLGRIGPAARAAVPALIELSQNEDGDVREAAALALSSIRAAMIPG